MKDKTTLLTMLKVELSEINATVNQNLQTITENLKLLKEQKEVLRPLLLFNTDAWAAAKLRNNSFLDTTADLFKFLNLYTVINIANEGIKYRENYRVSNQGMFDYGSKLEKIDEDIKIKLEKIRPLLQNAQAALYVIQIDKVNGRSFSIDSTGFVIDK